MLTVKQEAFAQWVAAGKTPPAAYSLAYDCENMADVTIEREGYKLMHHPAVLARVEDLRRAAFAVKLEDHLNDLKTLRDEAKDNGQYSAAITAEVSRGKASGLYVERREIKTEAVPQLIIEQPADAPTAN